VAAIVAVGAIVSDSSLSNHFSISPVSRSISYFCKKSTMSIRENIIAFKKNIPENVRLVAVSKTKPVEAIREAYATGHLDFGENKAQELSDKYPQLPHDIRWHFIGHLQTNKVKYIAPFVHLIHAVDSLKLLKEINKQAVKNNRTISCLLQFHIASESTKFGMNIQEARQLLESDLHKNMRNIQILGVMGMATLTDDPEQVRNEFRQLRRYYEELKSDYFTGDDSFREISMGMSHDYKIAIEEGATIIRIGTAIFGERNYQV